MFGLFRPSCPCDSAAKGWIEKRLRWLSEQFEDSAFSGLPVVLPTNHFFPDRTTLNKPEYMTAPMYAYALAHLAWFRDEPRPAWAKHLHWHFRPEFKQALRYLLETGDSSFQPGDTARAV